MSLFHYHNHTSGSLLDGSIDIDRLILYAKENNLPAIGITDHGNMIKIFEFWDKCKKANIKPVLGCEFYMGEKDTKDKFHIIIIAKNNKGLHNMYKLQEFAWVENFYSKPRIDYEHLVKYKEGLIITTACLGGQVGQNVLANDYNEAFRTIMRLKKEFPDLYLELQPNGTKEQIKVNKFLLNTSSKLCLPCVVGCDAHYINKEDAEAHDTMLCMQVQKKKQDEKRFRMNPREFYLKSEEEVIHQLNIVEGIPIEDVNKIIENTNNIPNLCDAEIETGLDLLPHFTDNAEYKLALECNEGYKRRYGNTFRKDVIERVKYELSVIKEKGYPGYFLIVQDFLNYARSRGILVGDGRGSCCGSMVAYLLGIHNIDPIENGLYFERFLNPERVSMPDIDSDIQYDRRQEVIDYVVEKYGYKNVAQIMAEGSMKAKKAIRSVLSSYDFLQVYINKICKSCPEGMSLREAYNNSQEFKGYMDKHKKQFSEMLILENLMSNASTHAAGVIIAPDKISNYAPIMKTKTNELMICQWHKKIVEKVGLYKFDFLGLKTLSILAFTQQYIKQIHGIDVDLNKIDINAPEIYEQLNSGHLSGIFQFEAPSAAQIIDKLKPTCFNDIVIAESICRPGVKEAEMCINNKANGYKRTGIKAVDDVLEETYGAIVYQEQTMLIMNIMAGWSLGFGDKMRKVDNLEEYRDKFVTDSIKNGYTEKQANTIFDRFSLEYSFNKSHACAYGLLSAKTAYLLNKYPKEFMCAVMTVCQYDDKAKEKIPAILKECLRMDLTILPPDINISTDKFIPTKDGIVLPLTMINRVGDKAMESILSNRITPYVSLIDFLNRVNKRTVNKGVASNLIKGGAFDNISEFGENRIKLLEYYYQTRNEKYELGYTWSNDILYAFEKEVIGMNLTKSPLDKTSCPKFDEIEEGGTMYVTCILHDTKVIRDRRGNEMAFVTIETKYDIIKGVIFSKTYKAFEDLIRDNMLIKLYGKKDKGSLLVNGLER